MTSSKSNIQDPEGALVFDSLFHLILIFQLFNTASFIYLDRNPVIGVYAYTVAISAVGFKIWLCYYEINSRSIDVYKRYILLKAIRIKRFYKKEGIRGIIAMILGGITAIVIKSIFFLIIGGLLSVLIILGLPVAVILYFVNKSE